MVAASHNREQTSGAPHGQPFYVLGLTGSIGMGKSTVSDFFRELGVPVLDADQVVHQLYARGGKAVPLVAARFPNAVIEQAVDRRELGKYVLGDAEAMKALEGIVHPLVGEARRDFLASAQRAGHKLVVLDIPLLYETALEGEVDAVAVVSCPAGLQRERVLARPGMTPEKFEAILGRQVPDAEKRRRADYVIDTGCSQQETRQHVGALLQALQGRRGQHCVVLKPVG